MARNEAYDSQELQSLDYPYVPNEGELKGRPIWVDGLNAFVTWGGKLRKRPGLINQGVASVSVYPDRLWFYETLESSPRVYLVGSFKNGAVWELRYVQLNPTPGSWTLATARRDSNSSTFPHEGCVRRGKLYIKGTPNGAGDKIGAIYLDGTGGTMVTHDWGSLGPTEPAHATNPAGWAASDDPITVRNGWGYVYTWVKASGHETNRSPLETDVTEDPSFTGPFTDLLPEIEVEGHSDTTEYPYIAIYRTTDGGGTFFFLEQITNTGAGTITYTDDSRPGGDNPVPDEFLDTSRRSPSLTSNGPPPAVTPPQVTGTDAVKRSSRIVEYAGRLWYFIEEFLFYSALEELDEGVPEEAFPSGVRGNFYRFNSAGMNLLPQTDGLICFVRRDTIMVTGTSKSTFNPRPFLPGVGGAPGQPRAGCVAGENVAWLTQDYRVGLVRGNQYAILSDDLGASRIKDLVDGGSEVELVYWAQGDKDYLIVACHRSSDTTATRWFVYDFAKSRREQTNFWFVPWGVRSTALASGQVSATASENRAMAALWNGSATVLGYVDPTGATATDPNPAGGTSNFAWNVKTSLLHVPQGNHVNNLREPNLSPAFTIVMTERTTYSGDSDPTITAYFDDFGTTAVAPDSTSDPPRRPQSTGYETKFHHYHRVAKHVAINVAGNTDDKQAELHQLTWSWLPESGA